MKILLIIMEFPPDRGGVENYYAGLVSELQASGLEVDVMVDEKTKESKNQRIKESINQEINVLYSAFFYKYFWPKWFKLYFQLKNHLKNHHYDYIWVGQILPVGTVVYLLRKKFKLKYFVSTHGLDVLTPQTKARKTKLMKKIFKKAHFVTANSQYTKNELLKLGLADDKVEVIYPGVNEIKKSSNQVINKSPASGESASGRSNQVIKKLNNLDNKKILLTVGRLVRRKGQDLVIRALPRLLVAWPDLLYVIIGNGPYLNKLRSLAEEFRVADKVLFLTDVDDEEKARYYKQANLFVMTARQIKEDVEGFGIVYLEANSYGLPVIASKTGGVSEAVKDGESGFLIEPENLDELVSKVTALINNQNLYQTMSVAAQNWSQNFSYKNSGKKLYNRLISL